MSKSLFSLKCSFTSMELNILFHLMYNLKDQFYHIKRDIPKISLFLGIIFIFLDQYLILVWLRTFQYFSFKKQQYWCLSIIDSKVEWITKWSLFLTSFSNLYKLFDRYLIPTLIYIWIKVLFYCYFNNLNVMMILSFSYQYCNQICDSNSVYNFQLI